MMMQVDPNQKKVKKYHFCSINVTTQPKRDVDLDLLKLYRKSFKRGINQCQVLLRPGPCAFSLLYFVCIHEHKRL